jgi:hypothetical protein
MYTNLITLHCELVSFVKIIFIVFLGILRVLLQLEKIFLEPRCLLKCNKFEK